MAGKDAAADATGLPSTSESARSGGQQPTGDPAANISVRVTQEKAISIQELTDLLASSLRSSQISSQAPITAPLQFFVNCKLQKTAGFPLLYTEKNGSIQRLNHNASTYWICDMGNWAAAHGLHNIFELCNALVTISADGSQRLPLFPLNPQYENFAQEH
jgi:hypothetical protein